MVILEKLRIVDWDLSCNKLQERKSWGVKEMKKKRKQGQNFGASPLFSLLSMSFLYKYFLLCFWIIILKGPSLVCLSAAQLFFSY